MVVNKGFESFSSRYYEQSILLSLAKELDLSFRNILLKKTVTQPEYHLCKYCIKKFVLSAEWKENTYFHSFNKQYISDKLLFVKYVRWIRVLCNNLQMKKFSLTNRFRALLTEF